MNFDRKARRARLSIVARRSRKTASHVDTRPTRVLHAPEVMSLEFGEQQTLLFLKEIRQLADHKSKETRVVVDLAKTRKLEIGAALALVAELDRWQRISMMKLTPTTVSEWHPDVVSELNALGFFRLLGTNLPPALAKASRKAWIQFVSDTRTIGKAATLLRRRLSTEVTIPQIFSQQIYVGLVESMKNAFDHAYPEDLYGSTLQGGMGKRWWMAASINSDTDRLEITFLDLGATIPHSLPTSWMWKHFTAEARAGGDADLVYEALHYGSSRLGEAHRGKGFSDITKLARIQGSGYVSILSRKGLCFVTPDSVVKANVEESLAGTLIKWYFTLDKQDLT